MATHNFSSFQDIQNYVNGVNSNSGSSSIVFGDKSQYETIKEEQKRLEKILREEVQKYYDSYYPNTYERTYDMINSITLSPIKINRDGSFEVSVYFNDKAYKPSVINPSVYEEGFTPILINNGWAWENQSHPIKHFTYQKPFNFGEKTVKRYNKENPYGFKVDLEIEYTGSM